MLVEKRMVKEVFTVWPEDTLLHSLELMRWKSVRHLPVLDGGRLVGVVTDRDIRTAAPTCVEFDEETIREVLTRMTVGQVMSRTVITADPLTPMEEAAKLFYDHHIGCLPIVADDTLVGIITQTDVLAAFIEIMGVNEPSSRLEVEIEHSPGQLAAILNIVKDHNVSVSSVVLTPADDERKKIAVIRLKTINPQAVVKSLNAGGFDILWPPFR